MKRRDQARFDVRNNPMEKKALMLKYRKLRNQATKNIRDDQIKSNGRRIDEAKSEGEMWKIVNDISKPNADKEWKLIENNIVIEDECYQFTNSQKLH